MLVVFPLQNHTHNQLACLFLIVFDPEMGSNRPPEAEIRLAGGWCMQLHTLNGVKHRIQPC